MVQVGAHVTISDGTRAAVEHEAELGGTVGQIFVGSPRGWAVSEYDEGDGEAFADASGEHGMGPWIVHGTYLINLATPKDDLAEKSVATLQAELEACATIGIPYYTFHPGSHTGAGVDTGIENIADRLSALDVPDSVTVLLENSTGKGTSLGRTFDQLHRMADGSELALGEEVAYCLDTCHLYAGGYDFTTADGMAEVVAEADDVLGLEHVPYLHVNDSKHPLGSEKDEHAHVGEGEIGAEGFRTFLTHDAVADTPMVLETPEDDERGFAWNIERVHELAGD